VSEYPYLLLAKQLSAAISKPPPSVNDFGGMRADLALLPPGSPPEIVELKILDEATRFDSVAADRDKTAKLASVGQIHAYLGVLVCETAAADGGLEKRISDLEKVVGPKVQTGPFQRSRNGQWRWSFCCFVVR
jgi:hypothetical protein